MQLFDKQVVQKDFEKAKLPNEKSCGRKFHELLCEYFECDIPILYMNEVSDPPLPEQSFSTSWDDVRKLNRSNPLQDQLLRRHKGWGSSWKAFASCICCSFVQANQDFQTIDSEQQSQLKLRLEGDQQKPTNQPLTNVFDTSTLVQKIPEQKVFYQPKIIDKSSKYNFAQKSLCIREEKPYDQEQGIEKFHLDDNQQTMQTLQIHVKTRAPKQGRNKTAHGKRIKPHDQFSDQQQNSQSQQPSISQQKSPFHESNVSPIEGNPFSPHNVASSVSNEDDGKINKVVKTVAMRNLVRSPEDVQSIDSNVLYKGDDDDKLLKPVGSKNRMLLNKKGFSTSFNIQSVPVSEQIGNYKEDSEGQAPVHKQSLIFFAEPEQAEDYDDIKKKKRLQKFKKLSHDQEIALDDEVDERNQESTQKVQNTEEPVFKVTDTSKKRKKIYKAFKPNEQEVPIDEAD